MPEVIAVVTVPNATSRCPINLSMSANGNRSSRVKAIWWVRRICFSILVLVLLIGTIAHLRSYLMVRRIQAVLRGLSEVRIDQTTDEQLTTTVPYLSKIAWFRGRRTGYRIEISNESDPRMLALAVYYLDQSGKLADLLGYRYIKLDATVFVENGRVSHVEYGLANQWIRPQYPAYAGYIVSARSAHAFWATQPKRFHVTSLNDYSPEYSPYGNDKELAVIYTPDAPMNLVRHAFELNLDCFWGLRGCDDARKIAPSIWHDKQEIQQATYQQLISGKCPDSIIQGRLRYLPDISVLLLGVTGSRRVEVNEEGSQTEDWFTNYKVKEVIRGHDSGAWTNVRFARVIPSVEDPTRTMANQIWPETKLGAEVLYFGNPDFYSCRFIPATPSALEIVRKTRPPEKKPEDEIPFGLQ